MTRKQTRWTYAPTGCTPRACSATCAATASASTGWCEAAWRDSSSRSSSTLSSHRQIYAWETLVESGLRQVIELRADYKSDLYKDLCEKSGVAYFRFPVAINMIEEMAELFPELCEKIDKGNFYIACAMGLHRTDIALCL